MIMTSMDFLKAFLQTAMMIQRWTIFFPAESFVCSEDYENADHFLNDYEERQGQQSTAAAKLQIKLNHLINSHKAPIKLYDDIIQLFNEYMCSDKFDKFTRLKSRKSFIKAT